MQIRLDRVVSHDHQRDGTLLGRIVARVVLDDTGDTDAMFAEDRRELGQHAGTIGDCKAKVIAALDQTGRRQDTGGADSAQRLSSRDGRPARPVTTSIRSPTTAEAVGMAPAPRP